VTGPTATVTTLLPLLPLRCYDRDLLHSSSLECHEVRIWFRPRFPRLVFTRLRRGKQRRMIQYAGIPAGARCITEEMLPAECIWRRESSWRFRRRRREARGSLGAWGFLSECHYTLRKR
jgi:hypothetical protein